MKRLLYFTMLSFTTITFCNPASLDTSFNQSGTGGTSPGTAILNLSDQTQSSDAIYSSAKTIATDNDTVIIAGYGTYNTQKQIALARYLKDGTLDQSFNPNQTPGYTTFQISGAVESVINGIALDTASSNIVATGYAIINGTYKIFIARFIGGESANAGTLDTSFNAQGNQPGIATYLIPSSSYGCNAKGIYIQSDSNIVITGDFNGSMGIFIARILGSGQNAGTLDTTNFGNGLGYATLFSGVSSSSQAIGIQPLTDRYIITGYTTVNSVQEIFVARYLSTGILDSSIANPTSPYGVADTMGNIPGYTTTNISDDTQAYALAIKGDGTALTAGFNISNSLTPKPIVLAQFTPNGQPDTSFNDTGIVFTQIIGTQPYNYARATGVCINLNGQIIVTGLTSDGAQVNSFFAHYNSNGSLNTTLSQTGYIIPTINNGSFSDCITTDPDGKIFSAGYSRLNGLSEIVTIAILSGSLVNQKVPTIADYGYNSLFLSEFLYQNVYVQIINDPAARQSTLDAINEILEAYAANYSQQPNFNYLDYLYLIEANLVQAQANLITTYPTLENEINNCFSCINSRILQIIERNS